MDEDLIEGFDNFVIGNFQACLDLHSSVKESNFLWEALCARCHLALDHLDELKSLPCGTAFFTVFKKSVVESQKRAAFEKVLENAVSGDPVAAYYACVARAIAGDLIDAINYAKSCLSASPSEFNALIVLFSLKINRPDLAQNVLHSAMKRDDSAAAKLVSAIAALYAGKNTEAYSCYSDLIAQFSAESSLALANGRAVANLQRGMLSEASEDLDNCLTLKPTDADSLVNQICKCALSGSDTQIHIDVLAQNHPSHPIVYKLAQMNDAFAKFVH